MNRIAKILDKMQRSPTNVRFEELDHFCRFYFGEPRQDGTSHKVYRTPWPGDPRVNIQRGKDGKAKAYQVRQVLAAITKLEGREEEDQDA